MDKNLEDLSRGRWREDVRRFWRDHQWKVIIVLWAAALVLGYTGFSLSYHNMGESISVADAVYNTLLMFTLNYSFPGAEAWPLQIARFLAPAVALFTVIQAFAVLYLRQLQAASMRRASDHVVICGLGRTGMLLARAFYKKGYRVIAIERDEDNTSVDEFRGLGGSVLIGDATDPEMLKKTRVDRAHYLVSVLGDDGANAEVTVNARKLKQKKAGKQLICQTQIVDLQLCRLLRKEMSREEMLCNPTDTEFQLKFFNIFEMGGLALIRKHPPFKHDGKGAGNHLLLVGMGCLGESVVTHLTRNLWLESLGNNGGYASKPRITVIDLAAKDRVGSMRQRSPRLEEVCELEALQMDVNSPEFARASFLRDGDGECGITMAYICMDDDSRNLSAAITIFQKIRDCNIPIVVRMAREAGLATLLDSVVNDEGSDISEIYSFGLLERTCSIDLLLDNAREALAGAIHVEYLEDQRARGVEMGSTPAMYPWKELTEDVRDDNRQAADHVNEVLKEADCGISRLFDWDTPIIDFSPEEVEKMARLWHKLWMKDKIARGWTLGQKEKGKKTNPNLLPWDELPESVKEENRDSVSDFPMLLARTGFQAERRQPTTTTT